MSMPRRLDEQRGRHAWVDGIRFQLPVASRRSPALMAVFTVDRGEAQRMLPGNELHAYGFGSRGFLVITVIDYRDTNIGTYIEYSIALACTRGSRPAPKLLAPLCSRHFELGQFVVDLPVSTEISVKGGKGIWGMPKHRANLDFVITDELVSSQYDLDGEMVMRIDVARPTRAWLPLSAGAVNFCQFRGLLMKSYIYFKGRLGFSLMGSGSAAITLGRSPRADWLRRLNIGTRPVFSGFFPDTAGVLDDHFEAWFLSSSQPPVSAGEGLEATFALGQGQDRLPPPRREAVAHAATEVA